MTEQEERDRMVRVLDMLIGWCEMRGDNMPEPVKPADSLAKLISQVRAADRRAAA